MSWMNAANGITNWLHMNGDGAYVWPCYIITAIVLSANVWAARRRHVKLQAEAVSVQQQATRRSPTHRVQGGSK